MKKLMFEAKGQSLRLMSNPKPRVGSKGGYLKASFMLDGEYDDADMVIASFGDSQGFNETAVELEGGNACDFPDEVTGFPVITVWLTCRTTGGAVFQTNKVKVQQRR